MKNINIRSLLTPLQPQPIQVKRVDNLRELLQNAPAEEQAQPVEASKIVKQNQAYEVSDEEQDALNMLISSHSLMSRVNQ